jgi:carbohydrate-binding DOMON domain-containing protein
MKPLIIVCLLLPHKAEAQDTIRKATTPVAVLTATVLVPTDTLVVCSAAYHALNLELRQAVRNFSTQSFYLSFKLYEQSLQACEVAKQEILTRSNAQATRNVARIDSLQHQLTAAEATTQRITQRLTEATTQAQTVQRSTRQAARRAWLERLGQVAIGLVLGATVAILITSN